jgi:hypothetical protein
LALKLVGCGVKPGEGEEDFSGCGHVVLSLCCDVCG